MISEKVQIQSWSKMAIVKDTWKRIFDQAKTHKELYCQEKQIT
jgi:hypothetical protein